MGTNRHSELATRAYGGRAFKRRDTPYGRGLFMGEASKRAFRSSKAVCRRTLRFLATFYRSIRAMKLPVTTSLIISPQFRTGEGTGGLLRLRHRGG